MRYLFSYFCSTHLDPKSLYKCSRILGSAGRGLIVEDPALLGERLCLAGLFCFWAVLSMWLHSWLLFRSFLTQRASKARQAAEKTGLHCNKVLCLLQGKISGSGRYNKIAEALRIPSWADESGNIQQRMTMILQNGSTNAKETRTYKNH